MSKLKGLEITNEVNEDNVAKIESKAKKVTCNHPKFSPF